MGLLWGSILSLVFWSLPAPSSSCYFHFILLVWTDTQLMQRNPRLLQTTVEELARKSMFARTCLSAKFHTKGVDRNYAMTYRSHTLSCTPGTARTYLVRSTVVAVAVLRPCPPLSYARTCTCATPVPVPVLRPYPYPSHGRRTVTLL